MNANLLLMVCFVVPKTFVKFILKSSGKVHPLIWIGMTLFTACVEPFQFESRNERPVVIIEGNVTDISSNEYESIFGKPRYFSVKVKYAGSVRNSLDDAISGAEVELESDQGEFWDYTEDPEEPGVYYLYFPDFASQPHVQYKVNVLLPNGEEYGSEYDQMPSQNVRGEVSDVETTKSNHSVRASESVIREFKGLDVDIQMPSFNDDTLRYYRWDFYVTFKLIAELIPQSHPQGICWVDEYYRYDDFILSRQMGKAAKVNLFFLQTSRNQRTKFGYALRIKQQGISKKHYQFWTDVKNQEKQADLFAPPPYNLFTNIHKVGEDTEAYGFFGVINEEYYIWFYDRYKLSYEAFYAEECYVPPVWSPAEWCYGCLGYDGIRKGDEITNIKPIWWNP